MNVNSEANFGVNLAMNKLHVAILSYIESQNSSLLSLALDENRVIMELF